MTICASMRRTVACLLALASAAGAAWAQGEKEAAGKIPITASSAEARQAYLKGRDLSEKLRATDSRRFFEEALAKDKGLALAYIGLATTAGTAKEFFDAVSKAVALAPKVTEGERQVILGLEAGAKGDAEAQRDCYSRLVMAFPNDERARTLLGAYHFGRQEWAAAIEEYKKAAAINPDYSAPYNQLGYAYRFLGQYPEAEKAFRRYIDLIPNDPNPHDSYAELLMKTGRFEESVKSYEKALSIDPHFVASLVGIGNDQIFMGRPEEARKTFARLDGVARNTGERRLARFWTAVSFLHEGAWDKALAEVEKMKALSEAEGDKATVSGDLTLMGGILREAGRPDEALARVAKAVEVIATAQVPEDVKEAARRNALFQEAQVALTMKDLKTARAKAQAYATQVAARAIPLEVRQQHEIQGEIALEEKDYPTAVRELEQANEQDPRALYLLALALQGTGDASRAREAAARAAKFNGLNLNYAFVRAKAQKMLAG